MYQLTRKYVHVRKYVNVNECAAQLIGKKIKI